MDYEIFLKHLDYADNSCLLLMVLVQTPAWTIGVRWPDNITNGKFGLFLRPGTRMRCNRVAEDRL